MKKRADLRRVVGYLLVGAVLAGCFVPVVYGVYKVYDKETQQVITIQIQEKPKAVYAAAIQSIEEKGTKITKRDDEKLTISGVRKDGLEGTMHVSPLPNDASALVIALHKGKDPAAERQTMIKVVQDVCTKLKLECKEEKEKK